MKEKYREVGVFVTLEAVFNCLNVMCVSSTEMKEFPVLNCTLEL